MTFNGSIDPKQLSVLTKVLDEYCSQAGIAVDHPARERLGRRLMELVQGGMDQPSDLFAALNSGYDEWLGEVGMATKAEPAVSSEPTSAHLAPIDTRHSNRP